MWQLTSLLTTAMSFLELIFYISVVVPRFSKAMSVMPPSLHLVAATSSLVERAPLKTPRNDPFAKFVTRYDICVFN